MGPFEMVVAIVIVVTIGGIVKSRMKHPEAAEAVTDSADAARMREEIRTLRDRVQVLERVITDNHSSSSLDREIERLRGEDRS